MTNNIIIVGKPNVGKSSLFNALVKKNLALNAKDHQIVVFLEGIMVLCI